MPKQLRLSLLILAAVMAFGLVATVAAQGEMDASSGLSGTIVGDRGGAYQTWNVDLPANEDVTLTLNHWPCNVGGAVGVNVWGASGMLASSHASDACTQMASFNTGDGGSAEIQMYDYLHGVGTWWSMSAEGLSLGAAPAAEAASEPAMASEEGMTSEAADTGAMTETAESGMMAEESDAGMMAEESTGAMAAEESAASPSMSLSAGGALMGNSGGAYDSYNLTVTEGEQVTIRMTVGVDQGGHWPGIGFDVWGPEGHVARGEWTGPNTLEASFTASGDVVYLVQPYNYHHGLVAHYAIETVE